MDKDLILLGHGSGGKLSHQLLSDLILPRLSGIPQAGQNDAAVFTHGGSRFAFTTDSYVVDPIFFPGGNIGSLAVNGTVNDLAMMGARPLCMSVGLIIEEGFSRNYLDAILSTMRDAADTAGVSIVTGDTKVVPRGKADRVFINTSGIGYLSHDLEIHGANARPGDKVLINGTIGDHGISVLAAREGLELQTAIESDCAPLNGLIEEIIAEGGSDIHVLRDPTRGGVATTLKEIALQSSVSIALHEQTLPLKPAVKGVCALLGLDPLYVANEGKVLVIVSAASAEKVLARMRNHPFGKDSAIIGEVSAEGAAVRMHTAIGGVRAVDMLAGEQLPRIC